MKTIISLVLVCFGLGMDANGSQNMEIALSLCFFFGAINLVMPAVHGLQLVSHAVLPKKALSAKRSHR